MICLRCMMKNTAPFDFAINLDATAKWLSIRKADLHRTLRTHFKNGVDYTVRKSVNPNKKDNRNNNYKLIMLTPDCFKRLCIQSKSKKADDVRSYFIEIESVLFKYRADLVEGLQFRIKNLERNQKPKADMKSGFIYVFKVDDGQSLYKLGRADTWKRIKDHESSHADDIDVLFTYETEDVISVESCVKALMRNRQYRKYKEIYEADLDIIKEIINGCAKLNLKLTGV